MEKNFLLSSMISAKKMGQRVKISSEQKAAFLCQVREYDFSSARDIVAVYEILEDSAYVEETFWENIVYSFLSEEEIEELDNFFISQEVTKMSLQGITARVLMLMCRHTVECTRGEMYILARSGEVIFRGYYKHNTAFCDKKQNAEMLKSLEKDGSEKLILKFFAE